MTQYGVLLADPPWQYQNWQDAKNGAASSAIVTEPIQQMMAVPVFNWAAPDSVLAMWTTWPMIPNAFDLADAWGFAEYVTGFPWVKTTPSTGRIKTGIGFWTMGTSELMLIFRRGAPKRDRSKCPAVKGLMVGEAFYSPPEFSKHSSKPIGIHEWLEALPGPYLELYARNKRPDWDCWGYDLGYELGAWGVRRCEVTVETRRDHVADPDQMCLFGGAA